jgi:ribonuclease HI
MENYYQGKIFSKGTCTGPSDWQEREGSSFQKETPRGNQALSFHWSLGIATNNQVEAYALYQGLLLAKILSIHSLSVIGDSKIIINHARKGSHPPNIHLKAILQRISAIIKHFSNISLFHVLRRNNQMVDTQANLAISLEPGSLVVNGLTQYKPIP